VAEQESAPSGIDTRIPNMARMYDYALGGEDNFAADRAAVEQLFSFSPENRYVPRANRRFLGRAVRFTAVTLLPSVRRSWRLASTGPPPVTPAAGNRSWLVPAGRSARARS
jgi:S-adenosyl methyltransferase